MSLYCLIKQTSQDLFGAGIAGNSFPRFLCYSKAEKHHLAQEKHLFLLAEVCLSQQGLFATKRGQAFAGCQALQRCALMNGIN